MRLSEEEIFDYIRYACDCCNASELFDEITLKFNNRATSRLGRAYCNDNVIELSTKWMECPEYTEQDAIDTVVHEACHLIAWYLYGKKLWKKTANGYQFDAHGKLWKDLMVKCGVPPERCYTGKARVRKEKATKTQYTYTVCLECEKVRKMKASDYYNNQKMYGGIPTCGDFGSSWCEGDVITVNGRKYKETRRIYSDVIEKAKKEILKGAV